MAKKQRSTKKMSPERRLLLQLVQASGETLKRLSEDAGRNSAYLHQYINKESPRVLPETVRQFLAARLGVPEQALKTGDLSKGHDGDAAAIPLLRVPIVGRVEAGAWREAERYGDMPEEIFAPMLPDRRYPADQQWAVYVVGDSVNEIIADGEIAHCLDIGGGREPQNGDLVVVERIREQGGLIETTIKEIRRANGVIELWPRSTNPDFNGPVKLGVDRDDGVEVRIRGIVLGAYNPLYPMRP